MKKFAVGLIAGVCVLALTLITLLFEPSVFLQPRWKTASLTLGAVAVLCMCLQAYWTMQDEEGERKERQRLNNLLQDVLKQLKKTTKGQGKKSLEAATYAAQLLNILSQTDPSVKDLDPISDGLSETLRRIYSLEHGYYDQGLYRGSPIPREEVLKQIEWLVPLAVEDTDDDV